MSLRLVARAVAALSIAVALPALAQTSAASAPHNFQTYQPSLPGTRISTAEAPVIDGDISDAVWAKAPAIDEFYQLEPHEGQPADERTVVHVLYDENNIYLSIMAYDDEPSKITAHVKARDGVIDTDDLIRIYLDPNMTRRNGYIFEINPLGARREGLIQNNVDVLYEWNTLWSAKARMLPNGWSVEVAIPFRSISYDKARTDWGFDFFRLVRRKNERIRWSSIIETIPSPDISRSGTLTGIRDINGGLGLDIQSYGAVRYQRTWDDPNHSGFAFRPSANAFYKITPSLTGTLTVNTDFSDTPLDQRQVNIGRFGLFYPETRDFSCKTLRRSSSAACRYATTTMRGRFSRATSGWWLVSVRWTCWRAASCRATTRVSTSARWWCGPTGRGRSTGRRCRRRA